MSMDDPSVSHDVKDTDMSEAATDDPELALGVYICCLTIIRLNMGDCFISHYNLVILKGIFLCCWAIDLALEFGKTVSILI